MVSTLAGTRAQLECKVEASPRSVNYWVKMGAKQRELSVNPGGRFSVLDIDENSYTQRMILNIEEVRSKDFGTYACVSRNSLGEVRTNVQLQGMNNRYKPNRLNIKGQKFKNQSFFIECIFFI